VIRRRLPYPPRPRTRVHRGAARRRPPCSLDAHASLQVAFSASQSQTLPNEDAVSSRLTRGRLSPKALADQANTAVNDGKLTERERAFLFAELILTLRRVEWHLVGTQVSRRWCLQQVEALVDELANLAPTGDPGIDGYLTRAKEQR